MKQHHHGQEQAIDITPHEVTDPVCGMTVSPQQTAGQKQFRGTTYYFCSSNCLEKFERDPNRYVTPSEPETLAPSSAVLEYTCPMHPQIVRSKPGACPICGMALEPRVST